MASLNCAPPLRLTNAWDVSVADLSMNNSLPVPAAPPLLLQWKKLALAVPALTVFMDPLMVLIWHSVMVSCG